MNAVGSEPASVPPEAGAGGEGAELTVVIIGLNAMTTLEACIDSVRRSCQPLGPVRVIYVDGGSRDESTRIAARMGVEVISLASTEPTAAKGRNAGWKAAKTALVQFVDSDTVLDPDWLQRAVGAIRREPKIACLFGQLIESNPYGSIYNQVCGFDWHIPPGDWRMCGGNALFQLAALKEADGFDPALKAGEEPDLCWRLRQKGYRIVCLDAPMARHDLGMARFSNYWQRAIRSGYAYAEIGRRFARTNDKLWLREFVQNLSIPPVALAAVVAAYFLGGLPAVAALAVVIIVGVLWKFHSLQRRIQPAGMRFLYVLHIGFLKIPLFFGTMKYLLGRRNR